MKIWFKINCLNYPVVCILFYSSIVSFYYVIIEVKTNRIIHAGIRERFMGLRLHLNVPRIANSLFKKINYYLVFGLVKKVGWVRRGGREKWMQILKQTASHLSPGGNLIYHLGHRMQNFQKFLGWINNNKMMLYLWKCCMV